jgi:hypothetical protein
MPSLAKQELIESLRRICPEVSDLIMAADSLVFQAEVLVGGAANHNTKSYVLDHIIEYCVKRSEATAALTKKP